MTPATLKLTLQSLDLTIVLKYTVLYFPDTFMCKSIKHDLNYHSSDSFQYQYPFSIPAVYVGPDGRRKFYGDNLPDNILNNPILADTLRPPTTIFNINLKKQYRSDGLPTRY